MLGSISRLRRLVLPNRFFSVSFRLARYREPLGVAELQQLARVRERVIPGRYLAHEDADGMNPGARYIRCALVHDIETTARALDRLARTL